MVPPGAGAAAAAELGPAALEAVADESAVASGVGSLDPGTLPVAE